MIIMIRAMMKEMGSKLSGIGDIVGWLVGWCWWVELSRRLGLVLMLIDWDVDGLNWRLGLVLMLEGERAGWLWECFNFVSQFYWKVMPG